jgi:D-3-phosphoglycerate dehydrogenase
MDVIYTDIIGPVPGNEEFKFVALEEVFANADFISLHVPKAPKPIIGSEEMALLKDGVYLVNTSRGNLIDEDALVAAIDSGKVGGAAIDVFAVEPTKNEKLYKHPKISVTPHIGAQTAEAQIRIGGEVTSIIKAKFNL